MTLSELRNKLYQSNVPHRWYSLDEGLKPDACILYKNYSDWEFFYLDEKGGRNDYKIFKKESEAFDFLWGRMEYQLSIFKMQTRNKQ